MKICFSCKESLPLDRFGKHSKMKDGLQSSCKECRRAYQNNWYSDNKELHRERVRRSYGVARKFYTELLSKQSCVDCGETRLPALQYDHRDASEKEFTISEAIRDGYGKERILAEIAKCDVRCANCHAVRTAEQFGWYKYMAV